MAQRFVSMWSKMPFSTALHTSKNDMWNIGLQDSAIFHPVFWALPSWFSIIYHHLPRFIQVQKWGIYNCHGCLNWFTVDNWRVELEVPKTSKIWARHMRGMCKGYGILPFMLGPPWFECPEAHDTRSLQIRSKIVFRLKDWNWFGASRILPGQHRAASYLARRTGINTSCHENIKPRWHKPRGWPGIHIDPCRLLTLLVRCIQCRDGVHMAVPGILRQNPGRRWRDPQAESGDLSNLFSWYYTLSRGLSIHISIREREEIWALPPNYVTHFHLQDQQQRSWENLPYAVCQPRTVGNNGQKLAQSKCGNPSIRHNEPRNHLQSLRKFQHSLAISKGGRDWKRSAKIQFWDYGFKCWVNSKKPDTIW